MYFGDIWHRSWNRNGSLFAVLYKNGSCCIYETEQWGCLLQYCSPGLVQTFLYDDHVIMRSEDSDNTYLRVLSDPKIIHWFKCNQNLDHFILLSWLRDAYEKEEAATSCIHTFCHPQITFSAHDRAIFNTLPINLKNTINRMFLIKSQPNLSKKHYLD